MKKLLLALGLAASFSPAIAQQYDHAYEYSVFSDYRFLKPVDNSAILATREKLKNLFPGWKLSADKLDGSFNDIYGKAVAVPGNSITEKVQYCLNNQLRNLGVDASEWKQANAVAASHAQYVYFSHEINGRKVIFSSLQFRFTPDGKLVRIKMNSYGTPATGVTAGLSQADAMRTKAMTNDLSALNVTNKTIGNDWVWFPVPSDGKYSLHPAWPFSVAGTTKENFPVAFTGYIDAINGELLYRTNEIHEAFDLKVKGDVNKTNLATPPVFTSEGLPNLKVVIGATTYYTDDTGLLAVPALTPSLNATLYLDGRWSTVRDVTSSGTIPSFTQAFAANGTTYLYPTTAPSTRRHVNAYYHVNVVHDFMKKFFPTSTGFTALDAPLPTVVDVAGSCNAFYNGNSINFYAAGGSCNSFAEIGDVVYHEYGHGISGRFYNFINGSGGMNNGALNEGCSDVWAMSITNDPILGRNAYTGGGNIRTYNGNPKVYPTDIVGEVHGDGEIIAGAWWDVAQNIGSLDTMTQIFSKTYFDAPDGPTGTEGKVYHDVLISALMNDDDDANLGNGTPHFEAIIRAFARHGILLLSDAVLTHTEVPHQQSGQDVTINAKLTLTEPDFFHQLKMFYRNRTNTPAQWDSVVMVDNGGFNFSGTIPGQPSATIVDYYFVADDPLSVSSFGFPGGYSSSANPVQVGIPYQFGVNLRPVTGTDFEGTLTGWILGGVVGDDATGGQWIQAVPVASFYNTLPVQTGADHTSGTGQCLVTGNAPNITAGSNNADVDGGKTTVMTPVFDLTGYANPVIEYYRWFSNDRGSNARSDMWVTQIHAENSPLWKNVESSYQSDYSWRRRVFAVSEYLTSSKVQMRFIATDAMSSSLPNNGQGTVEAGVDDFFIYDAWTSGVDNVASLKAAVYPNPADDKISIVVPQGAKGTITLYDLSGKAISSQPMTDGVQQYSINTTALAAGQYLLTIQTGKTIQSNKVVVGH